MIINLQRFLYICHFDSIKWDEKEVIGVTASGEEMVDSEYPFNSLIRQEFDRLQTLLESNSYTSFVFKSPM